MAAETRSHRSITAIRACRPEDAEDVTKILRDSVEAAEWSAESYTESLNWTGVTALVSEAEGKVTGFIIGRQVGDEAEILNLAVTPARRRKGEGGALLTAMLEKFAARRVSRVFLEVRESNQAGTAFYCKHGFSKTGQRSGYYREPDEAAVLMEKKLTD